MSTTSFHDVPTISKRSGERLGPLRDLWSPWTLLVAVTGVVLRVVVLRSGSGVLLADEAYTGLASMGVLDGRFPVVLDGNRYTAVLEVYAFAPVVGIMGPSIGALKILPMVIWAAASVMTYLAALSLAGGSTDDVPLAEPDRPTQRDRCIAAVAASVVWIAPGALLVVSTLAYPGYALGMTVSVSALWAATRVLDQDVAEQRSSALFGALVGLGFYLHPMFLAVLAPPVILVAWHHRRSVRTFWAPFVVAGVVVNGPFLLWNIVNGFPSLDVQNGLPGTYTDRLHAFATELVPRGYGLRDESFDWLLGRPFGLLVYAIIVGLAVAGCVASVRGGHRRSRWLLPSILIGAWPLMALFSPLIFAVDGRYNVITFPFVAIAVASSLRYVHADGRRMATAAVVFVGLWACVTVWPHTARIAQGGSGDPNAAVHEVVEFLEDSGVEFVAGSFWTVLPIEFVSDREISGAVISPAPVRFPERQRAVEAAPPQEVAFVFPLWAEEPAALWMPADQYERSVVADTVVYLPVTSD